MPLFKVSVESQVPVSAVVVSSAATEKEALEEVRFLQSRARVNWSRGEAKLGSVTAPYEIWAHPRPEGGFTVSLFAYIPISALQTVIAEDAETVTQAVNDQQGAGLIPWRYRGTPVGEYTDPIPTFWQNQQPDVTTQVALTLSPPSLYPGQSVTISATITGSETAVGNIEFKDILSGGLGTIVLTALEPDPVTVGIARAQAVVVLPAGNYGVVGVYLGSDGFSPSTSIAFPISVSKVGTTVTVVPPTPPIYAGQSVSLSATVAHAVPGAPAPTGTLTLFDGPTVIGSAQVNPQTGGASFNLGALAPSVYAFNVQYDGDGVHSGSSGFVNGITVQQVPAVVDVHVLNASTGVRIDEEAILDNPGVAAPVHSQPIRFRATVTSIIANTVPTGTVTFREGLTTIGTGTLIPATSSSAIAEIVLDNRAVGARSVNVLYSGNASFTSNVSPTVLYNVLKASTVVNLVSTNTPTKFGQAAQFVATVSVLAPATRNPFQQYGVAGSVTFIETPSSTVVNFNSSGQAIRSRTGLPVGSTTEGASFLATAEYNASSNSTTHIVEKADTTATMFFSQEPVAYFITFRIFCTVVSTAPGAGVPTGSVQYSVSDPVYWGNLFLGTASLNGSGVAELSTTFFAIATDTYTFSCSYLGSANQNPSSVTRPLVVFGYFG